MKNMRKSNLFVPAVVLAATLYSCGSGTKLSPEEKEHARYDLILEDKLSLFGALPEVKDAGTAKSKLGYVLYYDNRLSKDGTQSCNTCHNLSTYGVDLLPTSPGDLGINGDRNSPTVLNAALHQTQFWDGRAKDVEEQAGMPILNPVEMNIPSEAFLINRLKGIDLYTKLFAEAYPMDKDPITYKNLRDAIGAFERELITPSRFDKYLKGDKSALTLDEKKGMLTFIEAGCTTCHAGALLGGDMFQKFGVYKPYHQFTGSEKLDYGMYALSKDSNQLFMFKVPSLRNVAQTKPYFHDGSVSELSTAVKIMGQTQLDIELSETEIAKIVAFLGSLTGDIVNPEYKKVPAELASNK